MLLLLQDTKITTPEDFDLSDEKLLGWCTGGGVSGCWWSAEFREASPVADVVSDNKQQHDDKQRGRFSQKRKCGLGSGRRGSEDLGEKCGIMKGTSAEKKMR